MFTPGEYEAGCKLTLSCFAMLAHPETATARVSLGGTDVGSEMKEAMLVADKMASVYSVEIKQFGINVDIAESGAEANLDSSELAGVVLGGVIKDPRSVRARTTGGMLFPPVCGL